MTDGVRVAELSAYHVRIPLRKPIKHASHERDSTDNVVVRCVLEDNTEGFGEGVPRDYVTGETIDTSIELLQKSQLMSQAEGCRDYAKAVAWAERLQLQPVEGDDRHCVGNAARCALELALLDAYGKRFNESVYEATKIIAPELLHRSDWIRYSGAIMSAASPIKIRLATWRVLLWNFKQIKVKVGIEGQDDVARFRFFRARLSRSRDLRIDANEAWHADQAVERIRELEQFDITSVEQPIPHAEVAKLKEIRKHIKTPVMHDESLCSMTDAERAVEGETCDLFNLRLSKCGGYIRSLRLAQFASKHGLGYQLGCQVGETAILSAAGRHFASSVRDLRYIEGSYDHHLVREALATEDFTFRWGGWAPALVKPGLGVEIDRTALDRVTVRTIPLG